MSKRSTSNKIFVTVLTVFSVLVVALYLVTAFAALAVGFWPWLVWTWFVLITAGYLVRTVSKGRKYLESPSSLTDQLSRKDAAEFEKARAAVDSEL